MYQVSYSSHVWYTASKRLKIIRRKLYNFVSLTIENSINSHGYSQGWLFQYCLGLLLIFPSCIRASLVLVVVGHLHVYFHWFKYLFHWYSQNFSRSNDQWELCTTLWQMYSFLCYWNDKTCFNLLSDYHIYLQYLKVPRVLIQFPFIFLYLQLRGISMIYREIQNMLGIDGRAV